MSRTISSALKTHFAEGTTTIAICWRVERRDGTVYGYTSYDQNIVYDGVTYSPAESVEVSNMEQGADGEAGNMDIAVVFGDNITKEDLSKGKYDYADLYVFMLNYADTTQGIMKLASGNLGEISVDEYGGKFAFRSLADRLQNKTGRLYDYRCDAVLGDTRCGVDISLDTSYTAKSVIIDIADTWGATDYLGLRSVDFWYEGSKITNLPANFTSYETTKYSDSFSAEKAFDTSLPKIETGAGFISSNSWHSSLNNAANQRLICVFDTSQTFDEIRINNNCNNGGNTDRGVKNVVINISTDAITDTTYNAAIANSTEIFDGQFDEHVAANTEDEQTLSLVDPSDETVTSVTDRRTFTASANTETNSYYKYGTVEFTSGDNDGFIREVKSFASGQWILFENMPYDIAVGDTFTAIAGCNGFPGTCKNTFDNFVNFRGFPHLPGRDEVLRYPDSRAK